MKLNGIKVTRRRHNACDDRNTILIPLPREAWREIEGGCNCKYCGPGIVAYWDTLAVTSHKPGEGFDGTWNVHAPELHGR